MDLRVAREVNTGFGDGLAAAFEMVATPLIFGFFGWLLDNRLGTAPVFLIAFSLTVFGYEVFKVVTSYNAQMRHHESDAVWAKPSLARRAKHAGRATGSTPDA